MQTFALKLAIAGKDLLVMAPCRSGRTAAVAIAVVDKILKEQDTLTYTAGVKALCIGPTRDSCERLYQALACTAHFCADAFKVGIFNHRSRFECCVLQVVHLSEQCRADPEQLNRSTGSLPEVMTAQSIDELRICAGGGGWDSREGSRIPGSREDKPRQICALTGPR